MNITVWHIRMAPFVFVCVSASDYPLHLASAFLYLSGCFGKENVKYLKIH